MNTWLWSCDCIIKHLTLREIMDFMRIVQTLHGKKAMKVLLYKLQSHFSKNFVEYLWVQFYFGPEVTK